MASIHKCNSQRVIQKLFISFVPAYVSPHHAHSCFVEFQSQNRGHRDTRIFPSSVLNALRYIPFQNYDNLTSFWQEQS